MRLVLCSAELGHMVTPHAVHAAHAVHAWLLTITCPQLEPRKSTNAATRSVNVCQANKEACAVIL